MKERYRLLVRYDGIFGVSESPAILQKKNIGWDYWVWSDARQKFKKITRGQKYLMGERLEDAIDNIEMGGGYCRRKVIKIEKTRGGEINGKRM